MNEHVSSLYVRAHELLNLGMDGSPIYSDHFARLNREVYEQALDREHQCRLDRRNRLWGQCVVFELFIRPIQRAQDSERTTQANLCFTKRHALAAADLPQRENVAHAHRNREPPMDAGSKPEHGQPDRIPS